MYACVIYAEHQEVVAEANYTTCENGEKPPKYEVCKFNVTDLGGECTEANSFGYANGTPCVLLKINKVNFVNVYAVGIACVEEGNVDL